MLSGWFSRFRRNTRHAAEELMHRLEEKASLVVDDNFVADMGLGRKALYRLVYDMVRRERMFMLAGTDGRMLLMTNDEFRRFMFRRSGKIMPAETLEGVAVAYAETDWADNSDSDLVLESPAAAGQPWEMPAAALDWFALDIAPDADEKTDLPDQRQSMPDRKREPWPMIGDFVPDEEIFKK
jgi:hypothetical protein